MRKPSVSLFLSALALGACTSTPSDPPLQESPEAPAGRTPGAVPTEEGAARAPQGEMLQEEWDRLTLQEQKRAFLVEQHLQNASDLRSQMRFQEAEQELTMALDIDPDNQRARDALAEVGALLGREPGKITSVSDLLSQEYILRVQQLKEDAREKLRTATSMIAHANYDAAITELTLAQDSIRWAPYSVDWEGLDTKVAEMLSTAKTRREQAIDAEREASQRASFEALRHEEEAREARRVAQIQNVLDQALAKFRAGEYEDAQELAERVLELEPRNEKAQDVRNSAFKAGRDQMRAQTLVRKREQYKVWQEQMDELLVPYTDIITLPDREFWQNITELRARRRGLDLAAVVNPEEAALRAQLASTVIPGFKYEDEESLTNVVAGLSTITGLPLVVDPVAENAALDEGVVFTFDLTSSLSVDKALNLITKHAGENVTWTIRHDVVLVTTRERARGDLIMRPHAIDDLIFGLTDFSGPRINKLRLIDELEDDDGGGPFGGIGERPNIIEADDLSALVQENVAVGSWEDEGVTINIEAGQMIVVHSPDVQRQVKAFLEDLRRFSSSIVTIESKFLTVADNFIQEIGVDWRGLDNQILDDVTNGLEDSASLGLDNQGSADASGPPSAGFFFDDGSKGDLKGHAENFFGTALGGALSTIGGLTAQWTYLGDKQLSAIIHAVEKKENIEVLNDQLLSVHNTQRAFVTAINQQAYIQDFDVEVAQFQAIADPQINVLEEGIVLEVRPTIQHDRKYITLEVQPTVAKVVSLRNFSTTLGGQTQAVTFQLPELEVQSVFTTAVVPDGGSILLGGLSRIRNIERRAEVPWLANIPLVGFFFKEEGYSDEKTSLMIMIRAWITDVRAELEKLEAR
jgi:general secretion pathway protein D